MKKQRGYSLVEMMVTVTIVGILAILIGVAVPQVISVPEKGSAKVGALQDLQNIIHWVGFDAASAKNASGTSNLTLTMPDDSVITYTRTGDTLYRNCAGQSTAVAYNIVSLNVTVDGRLITMDVTSTPQGRWGISESRSFQVTMRPSGI